MVSEIREETKIKQQAIKALLAAKYNKNVKKRDLEEGDLVLRRADIGGKNAAQGKLGANWESPLPSNRSTRKGRLQARYHRGRPGSGNLAHIQPQKQGFFGWKGFNEACKPSGHTGR
ncbi:hypothetical protein PIB30_061279 [Stylosanthes scabra]|uniref:Uncharacterized protein n=1 Tax=Stylosanthes scabra TaxID=79078 RepID=A0ABU6UN79_9FABA|nr:hypothetical protein [Stylosanthes scabra]